MCTTRSRPCQLPAEGLRRPRNGPNPTQTGSLLQQGPGNDRWRVDRQGHKARRSAGEQPPKNSPARLRLNCGANWALQHPREPHDLVAMPLHDRQERGPRDPALPRLGPSLYPSLDNRRYGVFRRHARHHPRAFRRSRRRATNARGAISAPIAAKRSRSRAARRTTSW